MGVGAKRTSYSEPLKKITNTPINHKCIAIRQLILAEYQIEIIIFCTNSFQNPRWSYGIGVLYAGQGIYLNIPNWNVLNIQFQGNTVGTKQGELRQEHIKCTNFLTAEDSRFFIVKLLI